MIRKKQGLKYSCVKPETVSTDKCYSFSYNPEDQPSIERFYNIKLTTYTSFIQKYKEIFTSMKYCDIQACLEISQKGRLHWHGWIRINDVVRFYLYDLKKLMHYGTYEIDVINDEEKWELYVVKQLDIMTEFCSKEGIEYCINNNTLYDVPK